MSATNEYAVLGLMSGTSLDGLDITFVNLTQDSDGVWQHKFVQSKTVSYPTALFEKLKNAVNSSALNIGLLDLEFGTFCANAVKTFLKDYNISNSEIDFIASHGQTIFHQTDKKFTQQIGCGQTIATLTGIKTVNDFRTKDVILGGQGAPLVPIGDHILLKGQADAYLNLGGFSNVSLKREKIIAFDICPVNIVLNEIIKDWNLPYDDEGRIGKTCQFNQELLKELDQLPFYQKQAVKSLGLEWVLDKVNPILHKTENKELRLGTMYKHIANQICKTLNHFNVKSVYITGGGAKNTYLISLLKQQFLGKINLPETQMIDYKEALIFAFLGTLFMNNENNCLKEVTGASRDNRGGVLYLP